MKLQYLILIITLLVLSNLQTYKAQAIINRKLMMTKDASSSTIIKNHEKKDGKKVDPKTEVESSVGLVGKKDSTPNGSSSQEADSKHWLKKEVDIIPEQYPDVIDIAGMDYTPARKKSPIHN